MSTSHIWVQQTTSTPFPLFLDKISFVSQINKLCCQIPFTNCSYCSYCRRCILLFAATAKGWFNYFPCSDLHNAILISIHPWYNPIYMYTTVKVCIFQPLFPSQYIPSYSIIDFDWIDILNTYDCKTSYWNIHIHTVLTLLTYDFLWLKSDV